MNTRIVRISTLICLISPLVCMLYLTPKAIADDDLPSVKKLCSELDSEYKNKRDRDEDKITAIYNTFSEIYPKVPAGDQKKIVKSIKKGFDLKPPIKSRGFLIPGAACLAEMGKPGLGVLLHALKSKILKPLDRNNQIEVAECKRVKVTVIESIGFTKQPAALKTLYKLLWDDDGEIIKAVCNALACYSEMSLKDRKLVVEQLVKVYSYLDAQALSNPKIPQYKDRLITVEVAFNQALQRHTYQSFESATEWQKWYNDNKGKKKW